MAEEEGEELRIPEPADEEEIVTRPEDEIKATEEEEAAAKPIAEDETKSTEDETRSAEDEGESETKAKDGTKTKEEQLEDEYQEELYRPKCNVRIDELAKPKRLIVNDVYKTYKKVLLKRQKEALRQYLEQECAKTSEETKTDFNHLNRKLKEKNCRKKCLKVATKKRQKAKKDNIRQKTIRRIKLALRKQFMKVYCHPMQIIMTNEFNSLSDVILTELCNIRGIEVPCRESTSTRSNLMYAVSDFMAYSMNSIFYELEMKKVNDYEKLRKEIEETKEEIKKERSKE